MSKPSVFLIAYREVRRPVALIVMFALAILLSAVYPSDLDSYPILPPGESVPAEVDWAENYLRFVPTAVQIVLPAVLSDEVGLVQLVYVGVSTTMATYAAKRILNDRWILNTRLGQRPDGSGTNQNMPSGHSAMASSAVYFIGRRYSLRLAFLLVPILILTMYARVMLNEHTVSAVVAGALLGFLTAALCTSRRKPREEGRAPRATSRP